MAGLGAVAVLPLLPEFVVPSQIDVSFTIVSTHDFGDVGKTPSITFEGDLDTGFYGDWEKLALAMPVVHRSTTMIKV